MNLPIGMLVAHPRPLIVSLWLACRLRRVSAAARTQLRLQRPRLMPRLSSPLSGLCAIDAGYKSPDNSVKVCPGGCSGRGLCYDGTCFCEPWSAGSRCELDAHGTTAIFESGPRRRVLADSSHAAGLPRKALNHTRGLAVTHGSTVCSQAAGSSGSGSPPMPRSRMRKA